MAAKDLTHGSIPRLVIVLALPVLGSFTLQSLYALADLYFVGLLGGPALAGLSISLNAFFITLAFGMTLGVGGLAMLSQTFGAGHHDRVPYVFQQVFWAALITGAVYWVAGWLATDHFLALFTADPEVHALGGAYFRIYSATFLLQLFIMVMGFCFRAVGDFITPTVLMALGVTLNIVLDPLLIFGLGPFPRLGIAGAALASVIAQALGTLVYLWLVLLRPGPRLLVVRRPFSLDLAVFLRLMRIGLPAGVQMALFTLMLMLVYRVVRPFGGEATAAVGVGFRIMQAAILPIVAIGAAVSSISGQNYGARRFERVKATVVWGMVYTGTITCAGYGALFTWPEFWMGLFSGQPPIIAIGSSYLILSGVGLPFHGVGYMVTCMAQGLGRTLYPLLGQVVRVTGFLAGLAVLEGALELGLQGIFWSNGLAYAAEFLAMGAILALLVRDLNSWSNRRTHHSASPSPGK